MRTDHPTARLMLRSFWPRVRSLYSLVNRRDILEGEALMIEKGTYLLAFFVKVYQHQNDTMIGSFSLLLVENYEPAST